VNAHAIWMTLFGRRERSADDDVRETVWTLATSLTVFRSVVTSVIFVVALTENSHGLLMGALGFSMLVDFLDGFAARSRSRETIVGAQLDGLADRLAACFVLLGMVSMHRSGSMIATAAIVWIQFGVVDQFFSSQFLRLGLWSPDHFYELDVKVWRENWSPIAKLANNLPVALVAIGSWCIWPAAVLSVALMILHLRSYPAIRAQATQLVDEKHFAYKRTPSAEMQPAPGDPSISEAEDRERVPTMALAHH
jgi:CDP-diacylglycerol--glycerol-3-phosphate 3-phosphatidyltransferase